MFAGPDFTLPEHRDQPSIFHPYLAARHGRQDWRQRTR
ncbi:hypothetical protein RR42_s1696 [Cupriavidus basilensis]|uniref:Uncharacterized protein n=1 Tax=Cupriavidus basilensis TaxID=68895 RepID=A0A0C4YMK4_9BURK|nr:hypothetical protein RR42_s1696 [Cupriavidus basilensis]